MPLSLAWRLDPIVRLVYRLKGPAHIQTRLQGLSWNYDDQTTDIEPSENLQS